MPVMGELHIEYRRMYFSFSFILKNYSSLSFWQDAAQNVTQFLLLKIVSKVYKNSKYC